MKRIPTIFHVTNHKAGSQWVAEILKHAAPDRFVKPEVELRHFFEKAVIPTTIYPTLYVTKQQFDGTLLGGRTPRNYFSTNAIKNFLASTINAYHFRFRKYPYRTFVIIRDLRDVLVSQYFSFLISHPVNSKRVKNYREQLVEMSKEEGFLYLLDERLPLQAKIQSSWFPAGEGGEVLLLKFEDLLEDEFGVFEKITTHCQIEIERKRLLEIVEYNSFTAVTGRKRGEENVEKHLRKGIAGDWKNHLSGPVKEKFKQKFGQVLIQTGYETDLSW